MNKVLQSLLVVSMLAVCSLANAQIGLKLEAVPNNSNTWGVFVKTCEEVLPSGNTITGSGQVTIKFPVGHTVSNLTSIAGTWGLNATVTNPSEANGYIYVSIGFLVDNPQITYQPDAETQLFTFKLTGSATGIPQLIENGIDPFDQLPNSANSNPGNELTVLDFGVQPLGLYTYTSNYAGTTVVCGSEPQDTTTIEPPIDTTGNSDTTVIDTIGTTDTTTIDTIETIDTTVINPPGDSTQQASGAHDLKKRAEYFTLFPTPAYEWVTVRFLNPEMQGGTIQLFTLYGIAIGEIERGQKDEVRLNISGLPPGMYVLRYVKDGRALQQSKFLKQ